MISCGTLKTLTNQIIRVLHLLFRIFHDFFHLIQDHKLRMECANLKIIQCPLLREFLSFDKLGYSLSRRLSLTIRTPIHFLDGLGLAIERILRPARGR